ncbi:ABC transporter permease [Yinghuangia aomiensis]
MGLDRPLLVQYGDYLGGLLTGDMGESLYDGSSVADQVGRALPVSLELGFLATVLAGIPALVLGTWSALRQGRAVDRATRVLTVLAMSLPGYWLAVVLMVMVDDPDFLPGAGGFVHFTDDPVRNLQVLLLPALVLGLAAFAMVTRSLRGGLVEAYASDHVAFARAMGSSRLDVLRRVALRGAVVPTLTVAGVLIGGLLSGTVLVENVFQIPGLGQLMVTALPTPGLPARARRVRRDRGDLPPAQPDRRPAVPGRGPAHPTGAGPCLTEPRTRAAPPEAPRARPPARPRTCGGSASPAGPASSWSSATC